MADNLGMTQGGIILIGGGGHAKVVLDAMRCAGNSAAGYVDDSDSSAIRSMSICPVYLGTIDACRSASRALLIAIGDVGVRRGLIGSLEANSVFGSVIHPSVIIAQSAEINDGVFVGPRAIINADARICSHAIINSGAIVEHDCVIGLNTHIAPGAALGGGVRVGDHTLVGIGSTIIPGVRIGSGCTIGAGSVVTRDVEDGATVVGVPAHNLGTIQSV